MTRPDKSAAEQATQPRRALTIIAGCVVGAAVISTILGASDPAGETTKSRPHHESRGTVTLAYAGDSTTAWPDSWLNQLDNPRILAIGGYAHSGYTSEEILANIGPVRADVLVVMVGINDFHFAQSNSVSAVVADVNSTVKRVGARHQLISAVAPSDITDWPTTGADSRALQTQLNLALAKDAARHGWAFVDPYALIRNRSTGGFENPALTIDGIHPTAPANAIVAAAMGNAILAAAGE